MRRRGLWSLLLLGLGCEFNPVARMSAPTRLSDERTQVLSTLDARGEYVLIAHAGEGRAPSLAISRWRAEEQCELPVLGDPLAAPLPKARGAKAKAVFYVPLAVPDGEQTQLMLVDDQCQSYGPFGSLVASSARTAIGGHDQGGYLLFRGADSRLMLLDPRRELSARALANEVSTMRATQETRGEQRDAVWLVSAGELRLMTLDGVLLAAMGSDVKTFSLARSGERIAFIDGDALYEATAPDFAPRRIAGDACSPGYSGSDLQFFSPCEPETLQRVNLDSGDYAEFAAGVFASQTQEGVQLDYSKDEAGESQLSATYRDGERVLVEPMLDGGHIYVLDDTRIAGLSGDAFGAWSRDDRQFTIWLSNVANVVPHHRGKMHTFSWLVHHDVEDALGTLSLVDQDGALSEVARGVPLPAQQGFLIEDGSAIADYPFAAPLVVLLQDAYALESEELSAVSEIVGRDAMRFCGRLQALSITGAPRAALADDVCSYVLVAAPVPGVIYSVDAGEKRGLWFQPL